MKEKPRGDSLKTFVHTYKFQHFDSVVSLTKMFYNYMYQEKFIELPSVVQLFNKSTKTISPKNN